MFVINLAAAFVIIAFIYSEEIVCIWREVFDLD